MVKANQQTKHQQIIWNSRGRKQHLQRRGFCRRHKWPGSPFPEIVLKVFYGVLWWEKEAALCYHWYAYDCTANIYTCIYHNRFVQVTPCAHEGVCKYVQLEWRHSASYINSITGSCACAGNSGRGAGRCRGSMSPCVLQNPPGAFSIMLRDDISMARLGSAPAEPGHSRADGLLIKILVLYILLTLLIFITNKNAPVR